MQIRPVNFTALPGQTEQRLLRGVAIGVSTHADAHNLRLQRLQQRLPLILEAQVLARDIMSGRLAGLKMKELKRMQKAGEKYANPVYSKQGGTPAASNNGQAIARLFEITPGSSQPWILCAKQGKAHETSEGLIVMEGKPETTIRVPCSDIALKQLALAIEAAVMTWVQLRFVPAAAPAMQVAAEKRKEAIDKAKADSAFRAMENAGRV